MPANKITLDSGAKYTLMSCRVTEAVYDEEDDDTCYRLITVGSSPIFFTDGTTATSIRIYVDGPKTKNVDDIVNIYLSIP